MDLRAIIVAILAALALSWLVLIVILWRHRISRDQAGTALRLIPDILRLARRLVADRATPRPVRLALVGLIAYLLMPIDPIPDFLPGIGQLDDLIVAALVLGWVARRLGRDHIEARWPGTPESLELLARLLRWPPRSMRGPAV